MASKHWVISKTIVLVSVFYATILFWLAYTTGNGFAVAYSFISYILLAFLIADNQHAAEFVFKLGALLLSFSMVIFFLSQVFLFFQKYSFTNLYVMKAVAVSVFTILALTSTGFIFSSDMRKLSIAYAITVPFILLMGISDWNTFFTLAASITGYYLLLGAILAGIIYYVKMRIGTIGQLYSLGYYLIKSRYAHYGILLLIVVIAFLPIWPMAKPIHAFTYGVTETGKIEVQNINTTWFPPPYSLTFLGQYSNSQNASVNITTYNKSDIFFTNANNYSRIMSSANMSYKGFVGALREYGTESFLGYKNANVTVPIPINGIAIWVVSNYTNHADIRIEQRYTVEVPVLVGEALVYGNTSTDHSYGGLYDAIRYAITAYPK